MSDYYEDRKQSDNAYYERTQQQNREYDEAKSQSDHEYYEEMRSRESEGTYNSGSYISPRAKRNMFIEKIMRHFFLYGFSAIITIFLVSGCVEVSSIILKYFHLIIPDKTKLLITLFPTAAIQIIVLLKWKKMVKIYRILLVVTIVLILIFAITYIIKNKYSR